MDQVLIEFFQQGIPFNEVLGIRVEHLGEEVVRIRIPFTPHLVGDPFRPALHGGVLSTLADVGGGLAVIALTDFQLRTASTPGDAVSTVDMRIDFLRPALLADVLCDARLVRAGNRVAVTTMTLYQGDPSVPCAEARGVYNIRRGAGG